MDIYQSLVTVNPVTLIGQICNLFIQLLLVKIFFLDKIKAILDQRREAADKQIADAEAAKSAAAAIKPPNDPNTRPPKATADEPLQNPPKTPAARSDEIIRQAQQQASQIKSKASADIEMEKKKAVNEAKNEISGLALAIAGKVVQRELKADDQEQLIDRFLDELGGAV